jgi:hypothetical protein
VLTHIAKYIFIGYVACSSGIAVVGVEVVFVLEVLPVNKGSC